jgi:hypothetical protein
MKDTRFIINSEVPKCSNCNKLSHVASRCYLKDRKDARVNQVTVRDENPENNSDINCYNCQGKWHIARHCKKRKKLLGKPGLIKERNGGSNYSENEFGPSESSSRPTVRSTQ